jgi:hypothetical protein
MLSKYLKNVGLKGRQIDWPSQDATRLGPALAKTTWQSQINTSAILSTTPILPVSFVIQFT